jgi:prepilin-type N-terminal cleavage/methylation domain-containing protein
MTEGARDRLRSGFTLVELLAAIGIIAILAAMLFPALRAVQRKSREKAARATIDRLKLALEQYQADFGDYPPTTLGALGVATNGVNEGIESVVRCVTTTRERGPYFPAEEKELANTDEDTIARDPCASTIGSREAFELVDPWGNPFVYFHHRDYRGGQKIERYAFPVHGRLPCKPRPSEKTGQYPGAASFMVWSVGANGENEDGSGDDITSWN